MHRPQAAFVVFAFGVVLGSLAAPTLSSVNIDSIIDKAMKMEDPEQAVVALQRGIDMVGRPRPDSAAGVVRLLDAVGDLQSKMHNPSEALRAHLQAREAQAVDPAPLKPFTALRSHGAVAADYRMLGRHSAAMAEVAAAKSLVSRWPEEDTVTDRGALMAIVLDLESSTQDCGGDPFTALAAFEAARASSGATWSSSDYRRHVDLLRKASLALSSGVTGPRNVSLAAMNEKIEANLAASLSSGTYTHRDQLPRKYIPGLTARPWHDAKDFNGLTAAKHMLESRSEAIAAEYTSVVASSPGMLQPDYECIHAPAKGAWMKFNVNTPWKPLFLAGPQACSRLTPVTCRVLAELAEIPGVVIFRAEFSVLEPGTWIQPHYGLTNGQLKFHLGLSVPSGPGGVPCAHFRVGSPPYRHWETGVAFLFDDSFNHEVWNNCTSRRAILQVVLMHPDIVAKKQRAPTLEL